ncbi:MAG TPA: HEAT repeat domain-containing protein [Gemmataceae bacterium]|nr:HEAT repeat domain-containing protein [Gemmataceae bacterium]
MIQLTLGTGMMALVLIFGFLVWRLVHLPHSVQPAERQRIAPVQTAPPSSQEVVVADMETESEEPIEAAPSPPPKPGEKRESLDMPQKEAVIDIPPHLPIPKPADRVIEQPLAPPHPEISTADQDQAIERRLRASEDDLRRQLRAVPEVRVLSDRDVQKVRSQEREAQAHVLDEARSFRDAARASLNIARANVKAVNAAYKNAGIRIVGAREEIEEAARMERMAACACQQAEAAYRVVAANLRAEQEKIAYQMNGRLQEDMRRAARRAGFGLGSGPKCQLDPTTAAQVADLAKDLRRSGVVSVLGVPFVGQNNRGGLVISGAVRNARTSGVVITGNRAILAEPAVPPSEDRATAFLTWCDKHRLESMKGTVPTLTQILQIEDETTRLLLVRELARMNTSNATTELAIRALADLSPAVRRAALAALRQRPPSEYLPILVRGLRYPWPPVADHAALALRALKPSEAAAFLIDLLDLPSPSAPDYDGGTNEYKVREMVRLNHLRNCLLCHAPSANKDDGLVRGLVPTPGQPLLSGEYYQSEVAIDFVRADITFLRQDFSVNLTGLDTAPWPDNQRYDFVVRTRPATPAELANTTTQRGNYPQRDAVLYALRGLTGKDGGTSSDRWRELLGQIAEKPKGDKDRSALEKITISPSDKKQ